MATQAKFRHEDVSTVPKGWKVRTVTHPTGHRVRVAFPPGRRHKGSGQLVSILHPLGGKNPCANPSACKKRNWASLTQRLKPYRVTVFGDGKTHEWTRFAPSLSSATLSAREAVEREYPADGKVIKTKQIYDPRGNPVSAGWDRASQSYRQKVLEESKVSDAAKLATALWKDLTAEVKKIITGKRNRFDTDREKAAYAVGLTAGSKRLGAALKKLRAKGATRLERMTRRGLGRNAEKRWTVYSWMREPAVPGASRGRQIKSKFKQLTIEAPTKAEARRKFLEQTHEAGRGITVIPARGNPKSKKRKNLDEITQAAKLHERFVGSPATKVVQIHEPTGIRDDYAELGWGEQLVFHQPSDKARLDLPGISKLYDRLLQRGSGPAAAWREVSSKAGAEFLVFDITGDEIRLAASADGKQLYLLGGRQGKFADYLEAFGSDPDHDRVDLGELVSLTYSARKAQAGDSKPHSYYHIFGEEGGTAPRAFFDTINNRLGLAGGTYHLKEAELGIIN